MYVTERCLEPCRHTRPEDFSKPEPFAASSDRRAWYRYLPVLTLQVRSLCRGFQESGPTGRRERTALEHGAGEWIIDGDSIIHMESSSRPRFGRRARERLHHPRTVP